MRQRWRCASSVGCGSSPLCPLGRPGSRTCTQDPPPRLRARPRTGRTVRTPVSGRRAATDSISARVRARARSGRRDRAGAPRAAGSPAPWAGGARRGDEDAGDGGREQRDRQRRNPPADAGGSRDGMVGGSSGELRRTAARLEHRGGAGAIAERRRLRAGGVLERDARPDPVRAGRWLARAPGTATCRALLMRLPSSLKTTRLIRWPRTVARNPAVQVVARGTPQRSRCRCWHASVPS